MKPSDVEDFAGPRHRGAVAQGDARRLDRPGTRDPDVKQPVETSAETPASPACGPGGIDIARLAHELRTPLSAITVLAEIMRDERLGALGSARYRSYAADIFDSAAHANSVLASFLDAKVGDGNSGALVFVVLDLADLVRSTVSALEPLAERSGVTLRSAIDPNLPHLIGDRRSLRQILNNLIANALRFTPPGGEVVVGVAYVVGGPVRIEVADTGDGMNESELTRARVGEGVPDSLRRRSGGTGFGLPLVRAMAAAAGAAVEIDSVPRQGTRVGILFPHERVVPV